ncbi:hypothetical protein [Bosea massiliensis]|uniref:Uncharacterized protein n=1 Tax=Bosea massiliensis TaxID=151419 RepID=A0ABW0PBU4_9HYPH
MTTRIHCCVPFCRRTTAKPYSEWICGKHWPLVPKRVKLFRRRADASLDRARAAMAAILDMSDERYPDTMIALNKAHRRSQRAWERCKRFAIERAMGL